MSINNVVQKCTEQKGLSAPSMESVISINLLIGRVNESIHIDIRGCSIAIIRRNATAIL